MLADEAFRSYALVEFKHSDDAKYALKKLEGVRIDGSKWLVDPADVKDFKYFDWTPPSSVFLPPFPYHYLSCLLLLGKRCFGAAGDDISIRLSTTFAVFSSTHTWDPTSLDV
jgi:RNA recognition motif-containing protein